MVRDTDTIPTGVGLAGPATGGVSVTAAICTRARPQQFARALESLCAQRVPASEILVIDNAPLDDAAERAVARVCPTARYVVEPVPGLDFARNRALAEASGDIVAFLDDDVVASPGWVGAIRAAFESAPALGVCTGRVEALSTRTAGQRLFEANGGYGRGDRRIRLPADARRRLHGFPAPLVAWAVSVGSGASLAVRRDYARQLGGFDEALDLGDVLPGGGDLDIIWRGCSGPATKSSTSPMHWPGTSTVRAYRAPSSRSRATSVLCSRSSRRASVGLRAGPGRSCSFSCAGAC